MSIDYISKISSSKSKNPTYIFEVPSLEDEDALIGYKLTIKNMNDDVKIEKIEDYTNFFEELNKVTAKEIEPNKKEDKNDYIEFLKGLRAYIKKARYIMFMEEEKTDTLISDEDLNTITKHYKDEINLLEKEKEKNSLKRIIKLFKKSEKKQ